MCVIVLSIPTGRYCFALINSKMINILLTTERKKITITIQTSLLNDFDKARRYYYRSGIIEKLIEYYLTKEKGNDLHHSPDDYTNQLTDNIRGRYFV